MRQKKMFRQGDVLLVPTAIPQGAQAIALRPLAYGEVTGHAHRIDTGAVKMYEKEGALYLRVGDPAKIVHEEHATLTIPVGDYAVVRQREYSPSRDRQVTD